MRRPNRRGGEVIRPSLVKPVPKIGVVVDTSGSMSQDDLSKVMAELSAIINAVGADTRVVSCDAEIHGGVQIARSLGDVVLKGGGGTDMIAGIAALECIEGWRPGCIVVLTDGICEWPAAVMTPVVAAIVPQGSSWTRPPAHIATVVIE